MHVRPHFLRQRVGRDHNAGTHPARIQSTTAGGIMSLNDSLFGEEDQRWMEYWLILQSQKQKEEDNEQENNRLSDTTHKQDTPS